MQAAADKTLPIADTRQGQQAANRAPLTACRWQQMSADTTTTLHECELWQQHMLAESTLLSITS